MRVTRPESGRLDWRLESSTRPGAWEGQEEEVEEEEEEEHEYQKQEV